MPVTGSYVEGNGKSPAASPTFEVSGLTSGTSAPSSRSIAKAEALCRSIRALWKKRRFIVIGTAGWALVAVAIVLVLPWKFESTTRLMPAPRSLTMDSSLQRLRPELGALASLAGPSDLGNGSERFVAMLKSSVIADRLIKQFDLMTLYKAKYRVDARKTLAQRTSIREDRRTGIISVTVLDALPSRAAEMATAYVQELQRFSVEMNTTGAHLEREFLESRVKEVAVELDDATAKLSQFSTKSGMLDAKEQPVGMLEQAARLEAAIITLRAELRGQEQIYTDEALKAPRAKLAEYEQRLAKVRGKAGVVAETPLEQGLPSIRSIPQLGATYVDLARRVRLLEAVQMYLSEKLEMAKIEEVKQLPTFRVMEPADVPELRVWPRRTLLVAAATMMGLFLCCMFVLLGVNWQLAAPNHPIKALILDAQPRAWRRNGVHP